ncbi:MAG: VWA domain-containing protein, partial [Candidatus Melainabacteria bacterium]|nr:VWA domain-containing protein [Candidatus Melainabacteria bacterium]
LSLASTDGEVLLFNLHLSSSKEKAIEYPSSDENLPDDHSKLLYSMSSLLPEYMQKMLSAEGLPVTYYTRGFVFNADLVSVIRFLDIGTRPANLR